MKTQFAKLSERLRTNLWIVPAASTLLAAFLAFVLIELDRLASVDADKPQFPLIFQGTADSARGVLSTIAGSMITVAGTVYSLTIVVLTLASVQFAPRVLRSFMRDRGNQVVLGFFLATFTYCLLVLLAVTEEFVPGRAVTGGVVLALLSLATLIYFIDHIFHGIQVSDIIARVANETLEQIDKLYPETWREEAEEAASPDLTLANRQADKIDWAPVLAEHSGYLQYVDYDALFDLAVRAGIVIKEERAVGAFIIAGAPLALVSPADKITPELQSRINHAFALGRNPTLQQDVAYGIRQIVDIALKAISPAVNDPTTAQNCIDHLGVILVTLATRKLIEYDRADSSGQLRIIVRERSFYDLTRLAFDQIRHYGARDHIIILRLLDTIMRIAAVARNPDYRSALRQHVEKIASTAQREIVDEYEMEAVNTRVRMARQALETLGQVLV